MRKTFCYKPFTVGEKKIKTYHDVHDNAESGHFYKRCKSELITKTYVKGWKARISMHDNDIWEIAEEYMDGDNFTVSFIRSDLHTFTITEYKCLCI